MIIDFLLAVPAILIGVGAGLWIALHNYVMPPAPPVLGIRVQPPAYEDGRAIRVTLVTGRGMTFKTSPSVAVLAGSNTVVMISRREK